MNPHDSQYLENCAGLLEYGRPSSDRTGTGTIKAPGLTMRFFMEHGFPLLSSKFVPFKMVARELEMFLKGITDNKFLSDKNIHIWDKFVGDNDELGPIYGAVWRGRGQESSFADQIQELMDNLRDNPMSRRHIVTGWIPDLLPIEGATHAENVNRGLQALPPCHTMWQVHCHELNFEERHALLPEGLILTQEHKSEAQWAIIFDAHKVPKYGVSLQLYQRSADMFLGVPFNIASYSLLLHYIAHSLNMHPLEFIWNGGDCHIYDNHVDQMWEQIGREEEAPASPTILIHSPTKELWDYNRGDFEIQGYNPMPAIKGKMAV